MNKHPVTYTDIKNSTSDELSATELKQLLYFRDVYPLLPDKLFEIVQEIPPPALNSKTVKGWLNNPAPKVDAQHLKWVLVKCMEYEALRKK